MDLRNDITRRTLPQESGHQESLSSRPSPNTSPLDNLANSPDETKPVDHEQSLISTFDQLQVHDREQPSEPITTARPMAEHMFTSLGAVFLRATDNGALEWGDQDWQANIRKADDLAEQGNRDIGSLRWIREVLNQLLSAQTDDLIEATTILANAARDASWRLAFGQSGILQFFLQIISGEVENDLLIPSLRLIGNACADTDVNREEAISPEFSHSLVGHVRNREISNVIIPVVYNITHEYGRAQHAFREAALFLALIDYLSDSESEVGPLVTYVCTLLDFSTQNYDLTGAPIHSIAELVELMQRPDVQPEDQSLLMNVVSLLLQQERFQVHCVEHGHVESLLNIITRCYSPSPSGSAPSSQQVTGLSFDLDDLASLRSTITQALSDISATAVFARKFAVDSPLVGRLVRWLSSSQKQMRICSCLVLGNLARSDSVCREMVGRLRLHQTLLEILQDTSDIQVPYAALGFLRNLSLPGENKPIIGGQLATERISSFWSIDVNPQVQHTSISLLRQLLNGCIANVRWLLESLSPDPDSPAHDKTYLSLLLLLFGHGDRADGSHDMPMHQLRFSGIAIGSHERHIPPPLRHARRYRKTISHDDLAITIPRRSI
ncbi:MAG: hypothetical protein Q9183_004667 [Haloplaca sp. 2 TL-2023]